MIVPTLCLALRLSHEFLTGEVSQLSAKVKQLEKKCKKCPDDLKAQLKTFLGVSVHTDIQLARVYYQCKLTWPYYSAAT